jgi:hypothetical protein
VRVRVRKHTGFVIGLAGVACVVSSLAITGAAPARAAGPTFSDGTFADADWSVTVLTTDPAAEVENAQVASGDAPGPVLRGVPPAVINHAGAGTVAQSDASIEPLSRIPGRPLALAAQPGLALVAGLSDLAVLTTVDAGHPRLIGTVTVPDIVRGVVLDGRFAYVTVGSCRSGPMLCWGGLEVVDLVDPTSPVRIDALLHANVPTEVQLVDDHVYYVTGGLYPQLHIVDVSNPWHPVDHPSESVDVARVQHVQVARREATGRVYAYLAEQFGRIQIVDVTDVEMPVVAGIVETGATNPDVAFVEAPGVGRTYLYLTDWPYEEPDAIPRLRVVDVTDPVAPTLVTGVPTVARSLGVTPMPGLALIRTDAGLQLFDTADPALPVAREVLSATLTTRAATLDPRHALIGTVSGLDVVDLPEIADPKLVPSLATVDHAGGAALAGELLFTPGAPDGPRRIDVIDVADPSSPRALGSVPGSSIAVAGSYAATFDIPAVGTGRLSLYDLDSAAPETAGSVAFGFAPREIVGFALSGAPGDPSRPSHALLAWTNPTGLPTVPGTGGLTVIDVTDPRALRWIAEVPIDSDVLAMTVAYPSVYLGTARGLDDYRLRVVDVSDPSIPRALGTVAIADRIGTQMLSGTMATAGDVVYMSTYTSQIAMVDVTDGALPLRIGTYYLREPSVINTLAVSDATLYFVEAMDVGFGRNAVHALDITDPAYPTFPINCPLDLPGFGIASDGGTVAVTHGGDGVTVLRHRPRAGVVVDTLGLPVSGATVTTTDHAVTTGLRGSYALPAPDAGDASGSVTALLPPFTSWPAARAAADLAGGRADFTILPRAVSLGVAPDVAASATYTDTHAGWVRVDVGAGGVGVTTTLYVTPTIAPARTSWAFTGHAFEVALASGASTTPLTATVTMHYSEPGLRLVGDETQLALRRWDGTAWQDVGEACGNRGDYQRHPATNRVQARICSPGRYALFGPTNRRFLPVVDTGGPRPTQP